MNPEPSTALEQLQKSIQTFEELALGAVHRDNLWRYSDAFMQSLRSILEDNDCSNDEKRKYFDTTLEQYTEAMKNLFDNIIGQAVIIKTDDQFDTIEEVQKFNPYHDAKGRFSTANGYASFTIRTKDPSKQHMANAAIAREKERAALADANSGDASKKRIAEAESQIKSMLKDGAIVKLEGIDPENAEPIKKSIEQVLERYPTTKDAFAGFTTDDPSGKYFADHQGAIACYDPNTQMIHLNRTKYNDRAALEKSYNEAVERKHFPAGTTCDSSVVHEMGHAIDHFVSKKVISDWDFRWGGERVSKRMWNNDIKNAKKKGEPLTGKNITDGLSRYAGSKPAEYLAEGFSEWICSPNPRPMAQSIGKRLETYIKKAAKAGG